MDKREFTIPLMKTFNLESSHVGDEFEINVAVPATYGLSDQSYSLVYLTDANFYFAMAAQVAAFARFDLIEGPLPELILVGIGYPVGADLMRVMFDLRNRDLSPAGSVPEDFVITFTQQARTLGFNKPIPFGGADKFLAFIEKELDPVIRENYRVKGDKAGLFGSSFGGLFSLYAFLSRSNLFDRFFIGSIGLSDVDEDKKEDGLLKQLEEYLKKGPAWPTQLFLHMGGAEEDNDYYSRLFINYHRIIALLNRHKHPDLKFTHKIYAGESHVSALPTALHRAFRVLYGVDEAFFRMAMEAVKDE